MNIMKKYCDDMNIFMMNKKDKENYSPTIIIKKNKKTNKQNKINSTEFNFLNCVIWSIIPTIIHTIILDEYVYS